MKHYKSFITPIALILVLSISVVAQQRQLQVDVSQITAAYDALLESQSRVQLSRLAATLDTAIQILNIQPPANATDEQRETFFQFQADLAKTFLANYQNATSSQIELSQLVDAFLRTGNRIEIALAVTQPVNLTFGFGTERETRERAVSYVRILTNSANGSSDLVGKLMGLIENAQTESVAVLQQISDMIKQAQSQ